MNEEKLNTDQKALQINIDKAKYGTFAEIGAGQEVARWFFRVGGAAGTVAKTISAYDMTVSDAIYGPAERYVSRQRLAAMLSHEFNLVIERLDKPRGDKTQFFTFANTVTTRSYTRQDDGQGWLGIRFQGAPRQRPSEVIIHVRLLDPEPVREQEALGIVGVNLIHAAFYKHTSPINFIISLLDGLSRQRVEIDMVKFSGPCFAGVDNRLMTLQLVEHGMTDAAIFTADGESVIASEMLYKKAVLVERGSFRPLTNPMLDMLERAHEQFMLEKSLGGETPVTLMEMTLKQLQVGEVIDHGDFLDRVDTLRTLGRPVLISNYRRYHRLVQFLSTYTTKSIGLPLGLNRLKDVLDEKNYEDLGGGLMESLGQLFRKGVKHYVYPYLNRETGKVMTLDTFQPAPHLTHLYAHLVTNGFITEIKNYNADHLAVSSSWVLEKLQTGDREWEKQVPPPIAELIRGKKLFGCK